MTEEEQKAIEKLEIEGTENNYLEVKIVLDLVDKQQETLRKQSYTNKKLRNKIKTVRKERNKVKADIEIKDKVIDELINFLLNYDIDEIYCSKIKDCFEVADGKCFDCIKQYFYEKVENNE